MEPQGLRSQLHSEQASQAFDGLATNIRLGRPGITRFLVVADVMAIDDEKSALVGHLGKTQRIDAEFAEEVPQLHLDVGVLAQ